MILSTILGLPAISNSGKYKPEVSSIPALIQGEIACKDQSVELTNIGLL